MKTSIIVIAAAAAALVSCTKDTGKATADIPEEAVGFGIYTSSSTGTKGTVESSSTICAKTEGQDDGSGIGVFAFYQSASGGRSVFFNTRKFTAPDFMYNQRIFTKSTTGADWEYSPMKFWPSDGTDLLSFFAYAPYDSDKNWDDLSVVTDASATKLSASFSVCDEADSQKDILWAEPVLNRAYESSGNDIEFNLKHMTSKVAVQVGVAVDGGSDPTGITQKYKNTSVEVKSMTFTGLHETITVTYPLSDGTPGTPSWSGAGSQTVSLSPYVSAEASKFVSVDLFNNHYVTTAVPGVTYYDEDGNAISPQPSEGDSVTDYYVKNDYQNNYGYFAIDNGSTGWVNFLEAEERSSETPAEYMFLAPQDFTAQKASVSLTYIVKTADTKWSNCTEITETTTKELGDILPSGLKAGNSYTLKFLIGMDDVNVSTEIALW